MGGGRSCSDPGFHDFSRDQARSGERDEIAERKIKEIAPGRMVEDRLTDMQPEHGRNRKQDGHAHAAAEIGQSETQRERDQDTDRQREDQPADQGRAISDGKSATVIEDLGDGAATIEDGAQPEDWRFPDRPRG